MMNETEELEGDDSAPDVPKWEHRNFRLNEHMKDVVSATAKATESEIASLKRKLHKIQYGRG
jgi:hypothetical protein